MSKIQEKWLKFDTSWRLQLIRFLLPFSLMVFFLILRNIAFSIIFGIMTFFNIESLKRALILWKMEKKK